MKWAAVLDAVDMEADAAIADRNKPKGGQQVSFHGDFAGCTISAMKRIKWWTREIRTAVAAELAATDRAAWKRAMEEAAKACDQHADVRLRSVADWDGQSAANRCAELIRAIPYKEPT